MGFKKYKKNMSFLDMELSKTLGTSRTQRVLKEIHDHIRWDKPVSKILKNPASPWRMMYSGTSGSFLLN